MVFRHCFFLRLEERRQCVLISKPRITMVSPGRTVAMQLRVDVDDGAAPDLPFEHPSYNSGHLCEADDPRRAGLLRSIDGPVFVASSALNGIVFS